MLNRILTKLLRVPLWQKALGLVFVIVAPIAGFYHWQWKPIDVQVVQMQAQLRQLEKKYAEQKAIADDLGTFRRNTKELEESLAVALQQLPKEKEIPSLLRDIYTEGRKSGVNFKTFQPQSEQPKQLYASVPIRLRLEGTYHEIAVFFDRLGKLSRIVNVGNVEMSSIKGKEEVTTPIMVNCTATTYRFLGT